MVFLIITLLSFYSFTTVAHAQQSIEVTLSSNVTSIELRCGNITELDSNKTLIWERIDSNGAKHNEMSSNGTLIINKRNKVGMFICKYDGKVRANYTVGNFTAPVFQSTGISVTYTDGDVGMKLICTSYSYPSPVFTWKEVERGGSISAVVGSRGSHTIKSEGKTSVLTFNAVTFDDARNFTCEAENFVGKGSAEKVVRVKSRYASVWPIFGIILEVIALMIIIYIHRRRKRMKAENRQATLLSTTDDKPLNRDEGVEVRNRRSIK